MGNGKLPRGLSCTFPMPDQFCLEYVLKKCCSYIFLHFVDEFFIIEKETIIYTSAVTKQCIFLILKVGWSL